MVNGVTMGIIISLHKTPSFKYCIIPKRFSFARFIYAGGILETNCLNLGWLLKRFIMGNRPGCPTEPTLAKTQRRSPFLNAKFV